VSIIESALEKLRRAGVPPGERGAPTRSGAGGTAGAPAGPVAAVVPRQAPAPLPSKSIAVDLAALRTAGYLPEEALDRRFVEHYRRIKRPLIEQALAGGAHAHLILVSSPLPGDGKTFTSINLALSMARERDVSVLLVDADVARARITQVFGLREERGLMGALTDETADVESLIVGTDVPNLEILPAGRSAEDATERLASARMSQVLGRLGARSPRRLVLIDSAPLLAASEGRVLLPVPGQVVLVVRAGVTPQRAVLDAVALVDKNKLRGLVLNQASLSSGDGKYGYSGYSGYSGYGSSRDGDPARAG
jgi:exopolysaccharide/PEP-CTERM locus tyrosine autokinase